MHRLSPSIQELLDHLNRLPGVGPKTARRYLFHLLGQNPLELQRFGNALLRVPGELKTCVSCGNYSPQKLCDICGDPRRANHLLCVVADHQDLVAVENTHEFRGRYHILGGVLSPLDGITPEQLRIRKLIMKIKDEKIEEAILALNPDMEGESTMLYLGKLLAPLPVKITRLARGLPMGSDLEYADEVTLGDAIKGRRALSP